MGGGLRCFGGALAFGFAAIWIVASLDAALVCLASAAAGYGAVLMVERTRAKLSGFSRRGGPAPGALSPSIRSSNLEELPLRADELNSDLGHVYDPAASTFPRAAEPEYGWPRDEPEHAKRETQQ